MESYFLLFTDSLVSSLILPIHRGFVFETMLCFRQHHSPLLMLIFGTLGASFGGIVNWYLGKITISIRKSYRKLDNEYILPEIIKNLLFLAVLLFSWVPAVGSVIQVLSGYFRLKLYIFIPLIIMSNFFYCLYLIKVN